MYSLNMLAIALELADENPAYEDIATKFFEHFLYIAGALNGVGDDEHPAVGRRGRLLLRHRSTSIPATYIPLKVRSLVGLIPLLAVETLEPDLLERLPALPPPAALVPGQPAGPVAPRRLVGRPGRRASGGCWRSSTATA